MEDITSLIFNKDNNQGIINNNSNIRKLIENSIIQITQQEIIPKWKLSLWERNSIEPALLRVPIIVIVFIVLWGFVMLVLDKTRIQYHGVLSIKSASLSFIFITGVLLAIGYALCIGILTNLLGYSVEIAISFFYVLLTITLCIPGLPGFDLRSSFFRLLKTCIFPNSTISFPEIILTDGLTSMSKVLKDFGVSLLVIFCRYNDVEIVNFHNSGMILIALFASWPFWLRMRQCYIQIECANDTITKIPPTLNLIKYFTAFPPIWLAASASLGYVHKDLPTIIFIMATINSTYSFFWDIIMDWGFITIHRTGKITTRQRSFLPIIFYFPLVIINLCLRFSWAANRLASLSHLHASELILLVELAEVFRRCLWAVVRVEWEVIVQQDKHALSKNQENYNEETIELIRFNDKS